jgi:hypothetical protein
MNKTAKKKAAKEILMDLQGEVREEIIERYVKRFKKTIPVAQDKILNITTTQKNDNPYLELSKISVQINNEIMELDFQSNILLDYENIWMTNASKQLVKEYIEKFITQKIEER